VTCYIVVRVTHRGALKLPDYNNAIRKLLDIISCHDSVDTTVEAASSLDKIPRDLSRFVKVTSVRGRDSDYHGNRCMPLRRSGGKSVCSQVCTSCSQVCTSCSQVCASCSQVYTS